MDRLAPGGGEHVVVGAAPLGAYSQPFPGLALAVISKYLHGFGVDADGAGPAALGRSFDALPPDDGDRARDADLAQVQVDVVPAEVEQFAATGASVCGQAVEGEQPVLPGGVEEGPELGGCPNSPRFGAGLARSFCPLDRIGQQDLVNDNGVTERLAQYRVDILNCAGGQTRAVAATVCGQLAVELWNAPASLETLPCRM